MRELHFLTSLDDPPILMGDVGHDARFRIFELQSRLRFGVLFRLKFVSFSSPVKHLPGPLNADPTYVAWQHAAEIDGSQPIQRQADVRDSSGTRESTFELRPA